MQEDECTMDELDNTSAPSLLASALRSYILLKARTVLLQRAERSNSQYTSNGFEAMSHLSHEMLHDAMKGKDMATRGYLRAQGVGLQGYGTLHFATCHHDYLRKTCGQHVVCDSWQKMTLLQCNRSMSIALHASCSVTDPTANDCPGTC